MVKVGGVKKLKTKSMHGGGGGKKKGKGAGVWGGRRVGRMGWSNSLQRGGKGFWGGGTKKICRGNET